MCCAVCVCALRTEWIQQRPHPASKMRLGIREMGERRKGPGMGSAMRDACGGWLAAESHGNDGACVASSLVGRAGRRRCTGGVGAVARCASDARDRAAAGPGAGGGLGGADFDVNFYITQRSVSEKVRDANAYSFTLFISFSSYYLLY